MAWRAVTHARRARAHVRNIYISAREKERERESVQTAGNVGASEHAGRVGEE